MLYTYVKIEESIKGCVWEESVKCKPIDLVSWAVQYEGLDMMNTILMEKVASLEKSLQKDDLTEDEIKGIQRKIEKLNVDIESNSKVMYALQSKWEYAIEIISSAKNVYTSNDQNTVRNVLRLTACQENPRFYKYVVINGEDNQLLYEAMERIHQVEGKTIDDYGKIEHVEEQLNDYVISAGEIGKIAKSLFSLPIESEITKKVNIKFNKTDLAYIHSLYVKSLNVGFSRSNSKGVTYNGRTLRTLIQCKKDKKGMLHYNFTAFYEVLSKLAIEYLVK